MKVEVEGTDKSAQVALTSQTGHGITLDFINPDAPLTLNKTDTLLVTWDSTNSEEGLSASVLYADKAGTAPVVAGMSAASIGPDSNWKNPQKTTYLIAQMNVAVTSAPEPATATLSLLALAGLCARHRRH